MKKTYFLRRSNISILGIIGSVYVGLIICFSFIAFSRYDLICYLLLILMGITPILFFMYKYLSSVGLYICGSDIYYKKTKKSTWVMLSESESSNHTDLRSRQGMRRWKILVICSTLCLCRAMYPSQWENQKENYYILFFYWMK